MKWSARAFLLLSLSLVLLTAFENCNKTDFNNGPANTAAAVSSGSSSNSSSSSGSNSGQIVITPITVTNSTATLSSGRYQISQWSCGSLNIAGLYQMVETLPSITVSGVSAAINIPIFNGCSATETLGLGFPSSGSLAMTLGPVSCSSSCYSFECQPLAAPSPSLTLSLAMSTDSASAVTLSHKLTAADLGPTQSLIARVGCRVGDQLLMKLSPTN